MGALGADFIACVICYKRPIYFFCYPDWTGIEDSGMYKPGQPKGNRNRWLKENSGSGFLKSKENKG